MLVDSIHLQIKAGDGGAGSASLRRDAQTSKGGPDGGDGGNGGNIYFQGSHNIHDLAEFRYKKKIVAADGQAGRGQNLFGKNAAHLTFLVPLGTRITDMETRKVYEMTRENGPLLFAQGGKGGRGNYHFKTATNQTPRTAQSGEPGEARRLFLELRFIADIGLVGLPNAGKSSVLAALTKATPKIGNYPFTTLEPTIGMLGTYAIADLPGLVAQASSGKGLGTTFLKHIEKTKILLHCIDATTDQPKKSYAVIHREFAAYNPELETKPELILLCKTDLAQPKVIEKHVRMFAALGKKVLACSVYDAQSIRHLRQTLTEYLASS